MTAAPQTFPALREDIEVDIAIIGGGITGLTAALLLRRAGKSVAVVESREIASGVTGSTTAHLTQAVDARYKTLVSRFGAEAARTVAESTRASIDRIEAFVRELEIACDFAQVPGYLYSDSEEDLAALQEEFEAARNAGVAVTMVRGVPGQSAGVAAVRFENQAQFHVGKYLAGLAAAAQRAGCHIFEHTHVSKIEHGERCALTTAGGRVTAAFVISATDSPLTHMFVQTKIHSYRSYAMAFQAKEHVEAALYWDSEDPYHYTRTADIEGVRYVIVGGEDHKTGQVENTEEHYARLLAFARSRYTFDDVAYRWSSQVIEPVDGLPYIGPTPDARNLLIATGYSGTGMTFGTLAGMLLADRILGRENAWLELYSATRVKLSTAATYLAENIDVGKYMVTDRIRGAETSSLKDVARGEGKIVKVAGQKLAVFRDDLGGLHAHTAICPHLGCQVHFNNAEKTWDCPCHGSRFGTDGCVLHGPSLLGLAAAVVDEAETVDRPVGGLVSDTGN